MSNELLMLESAVEAIDETRARQSAGDSLGTIARLRQEIESFQQNWYRDRFSPAQAMAVPREHRKMYLACSNPGTVVQCFSDCVFLSIPFNRENPLVTWSGILSMLVTVSYVTMDLLALGHAIRGGVEIGVGAELYPGEVIGSSLVRAHELEKSAEVPRVLLGPKFLQLLDEAKAFPSAGYPVDLMRSYASLCSQLVCEDKDGLHFVNFLASEPELRKVLGRQSSYFERGRSIVKERASKEADPKIKAKYEWLESQFSRIR